MLKRRNKKGFTLAELLIVVAIIAVLIAIAVPIFVSALDKAEEATIKANERTLKGMVVTEILSNNGLLYDEDGNPNKVWSAKGTYDAGTDTWTVNVSDIKEDDTSYKGQTSSKTGDLYTLYVVIHYAELTA